MSMAFLYAGQGSQYAGMGSDLYDIYPEFRRVIDGAGLSFDLKEIMFRDREGLIHETQYTQPCMVAFACGMTALLREMGLKPDYVAGLSLGEYSALEAAGVFDAEAAIRMTAFRGRAMAEASQGISCGMSAVLGLEYEEVHAACKEASSLGVVSICNLNCPGQIVIGGEKQAVDRAAELALEKGARRVIPLKVSGPFHTSFMKPAGEKLAGYFRSLEFHVPEIPVLYNYLGSNDAGSMSIPELLVEQIQNPVRMEDSIRLLFDLGVRQFVEIGPGQTLSGFVRKVARDMGQGEYEIINLETAEDVERLRERLQ